ncbi:hypothetical protein BC831DRAFT_458109 [Entophlyctis helioformis]|nr:hypothetical protein BC831DRAFT_458109 [Entophlyctis helioformis]
MGRKGNGSKHFGKLLTTDLGMQMALDLAKLVTTAQALDSLILATNPEIHATAHAAVTSKGMSDLSVFELGPNGKVTKRRKRALKDPNAPKRPPPSYVLFVQQAYQEMAEQNSDLKPKEIMAKLGQAWRELPDEQKKPFNDEFISKRNQYQSDVKAYKAHLEEAEAKIGLPIETPGGDSDESDEESSSLAKAPAEDDSDSSASSSDADSSSDEDSDDEESGSASPSVPVAAPVAKRSIKAAPAPAPAKKTAAPPAVKPSKPPTPAVAAKAAAAEAAGNKKRKHAGDAETAPATPVAKPAKTAAAAPPAVSTPAAKAKADKSKDAAGVPSATVDVGSEKKRSRSTNGKAAAAPAASAAPAVTSTPKSDKKAKSSKQ